MDEAAKKTAVRMIPYDVFVLTGLAPKGYVEASAELRNTVRT